ncbi:hypothetical protein [Parabacteroides sp.]
MKTIDDILTDYCGCFEPAINDSTGKFSCSGAEAYKYLKDFITSLGDLGILDSKETIKKLNLAVKQYLPKKISDPANLKERDILEFTKGKKLYTYDSWDGSSMVISVEHVEIFSDYALFSGINNWGNKSGIRIDLQYLSELLNTGSITKHNTIEHCDVKTTWTLK